jgi:hypothetical protein
MKVQGSCHCAEVTHEAETTRITGHLAAPAARVHRALLGALAALG